MVGHTDHDFGRVRRHRAHHRSVAARHFQTNYNNNAVMGKLVGSCCGVSGILVMALPIPIVVENFGAYYMEQVREK